MFWDYLLLVTYPADASRHVDTGSARWLLCCVLCGGEKDLFHVTCAMQCMRVCARVFVCLCVLAVQGRGGTCEKEVLAGGAGQQMVNS